MKDKIFAYHPTLGYITYKDLIDDIELIIEDYTILSHFLNELLNADEDTIYSDIFFNNDINNRLANIVYILKSLL